jgi:hypothetical protein
MAITKINNNKSKLMRKVVLISLLVLLISCNLREVRYSDEEIAIMKHNIVENSDEESYSDYYTYVGKKDSLLYIEMLPYSLKMMDVKNYDSEFDFFQLFLRAKFKGKYNPNDLTKLAKPEQDLLIYYLEQGSTKESSYCMSVLIDYYRKGIYYKKDVKKADSLYLATYGNPYPNK